MPSTAQPQPESDTSADGIPEENSEGATVARDAGLGAGAAVLFLLMRLLAVSDWNWSTAAAVADTVNFSETIAIALGTLFAESTFSGIAIMLLLPLAAVRAFWPLRHGEPLKLGDIMLVIVLAAFAVALLNTYSDWWLPVGAALWTAALVAARLVAKKGSTGHKVVSTLLRSTGGLVVIACLVLAASVREPWMVRESIETSRGTVVGYVLEAEPGYLKVLDDAERGVTIFTTAEVKSRTISE